VAFHYNGSGDEAVLESINLGGRAGGYTVAIWPQPAQGSPPLITWCHGLRCFGMDGVEWMDLTSANPARRPLLAQSGIVPTGKQFYFCGPCGTYSLRDPGGQRRSNVVGAAKAARRTISSWSYPVVMTPTSRRPRRPNLSGGKSSASPSPGRCHAAQDLDSRRHPARWTSNRSTLNQNPRMLWKSTMHRHTSLWSHNASARLEGRQDRRHGKGQTL